jgi:hypothetical protein
VVDNIQPIKKKSKVTSSIGVLESLIASSDNAIKVNDLKLADITTPVSINLNLSNTPVRSTTPVEKYDLNNDSHSANDLSKELINLNSEVDSIREIERTEFDKMKNAVQVDPTQLDIKVDELIKSLQSTGNVESTDSVTNLRYLSENDVLDDTNDAIVDTNYEIEKNIILNNLKIDNKIGDIESTLDEELIYSNKEVQSTFKSTLPIVLINDRAKNTLFTKVSLDNSHVEVNSQAEYPTSSSNDQSSIENLFIRASSPQVNNLQNRIENLEDINSIKNNQENNNDMESFINNNDDSNELISNENNKGVLSRITDNRITSRITDARVPDKKGSRSIDIEKNNRTISLTWYSELDEWLRIEVRDLFVKLFNFIKDGGKMYSMQIFHNEKALQILRNEIILPMVNNILYIYII